MKGKEIMFTEKNTKTKDLVCPICNKPIQYTGDSDINECGETYYMGECEGCNQEFRVYEDTDGYDLWYEVEEQQ